MNQIPFFDKIKEAVVYLHTRFPNFALIGWDVSISVDGHPIILEYNFLPGIGSCQLAHGPMFCKKDLDEIMERVSKGKLVKKSRLVVSYPDKEPYWSR